MRSLTQPELRRRRQTRPAVHVSDFFARWTITLGGIGTILAVSCVFVFLLCVVAPVFRPGRLLQPLTLPTQIPNGQIDVVLNDDRTLARIVSTDGTLTVVRLADGSMVSKQSLLGSEVTATTLDRDSNQLAFAFRDGTVRFGRLEWNGETIQTTLQPSLQVASSAIRGIDLMVLREGPIFAAQTENGRAYLCTLTQREDLLSGETVTEVERTAIDLALPVGVPSPDRLLLTRPADNLYAVWNDGRLRRYDVRVPKRAEFVEEVALLEPGVTLTALQFLVGEETLLIGDVTGRLQAWFRARPGDADTSDGRRLLRAHVFPARGQAVTAIGPSTGSRLTAVGFADGHIDLLHVTSERCMVSTDIDGAVEGIALTAQDHGLLAWTHHQVRLWQLEPGHPEASLRSLFRPVWYEGYAEPAHVWQSSSATDAYEPKFGFMPLILGTLKATLYALLFAAPVALLAAIYTSEFLRPRTRALIKPAIELMASLPSVVLGFLGALVLAPLIEQRVASVLLMFFTLPTALLLVGRLWQLLPAGLAIRYSSWRLPLAFAALVGGLFAGWSGGGLLERLVFAGDLKAWLDGSGSAVGGWILVLLLPMTATVLILSEGWFGRWVRTRSGSRTRLGLIDLALFLGGLGLAMVLTVIAAVALSGSGFDLRGHVFGTYVQRNALVVGLMMGFAIIPLIYTLADDALSAVPDHLRAASLACGATPWQTAVRVVIPTAVSGLFAALMIGLGRAAGETMIVLMAAGNTPVMDWNLFNGFRTLSANLAVELPEAVQGSTHYRTLYLAALTLFALTFVVNTAAELVRLRFRKRAYQL